MRLIMTETLQLDFRGMNENDRLKSVYGCTVRL